MRVYKAACALLMDFSALKWAYCAEYSLKKSNEKARQAYMAQMDQRRLVVGTFAGPRPLSGVSQKEIDD